MSEEAAAKRKGRHSHHRGQVADYLQETDFDVPRFWLDPPERLEELHGAPLKFIGVAAVAVVAVSLPRERHIGGKNSFHLELKALRRT